MDWQDGRRDSPYFIPILSDSAFTRSADGQEYTRLLANRKPYLLSIATWELNAKNFTHRYKIGAYAPRYAKTPAGNRCIEQVGLKVRKRIAISTSKKGLLNEIVVQIAVVKPNTSLQLRLVLWGVGSHFYLKRSKQSQLDC